jgi:GNAT superfamily N-acetyltransferase
MTSPASHPFTIRLATPADAPSIAHVHLVSWQTAYRGIIHDAHLDGLMDQLAERTARWERRLRQPDIPGTATFVVESEGFGITGFVTVGPERKTIAEYAGELYAIYLLAEHRRHGLGRALFRRGVAHLRELGLADMYVLVLEKNPACGFYRGMGGEQVPGFALDVTLGGTAVREIAFGWKHLPE